ncbi:MAG: histidine kinase, partial [Actinomycetota bacterium]|nr:histidine kinase [Actinomycetota bacterium]
VAIVADTAVVLVEDDGIGIGESRRRSGLQNLADRAAARGGRFTVESTAGATAARWSVPLKSTDERQQEA